MKYLLIICSVICIGLILGLSGLVDLTEVSQETQYLRIHIRANSNSDEDQSVKYKVKDEIVEALIPLLADVESFDEAKSIVSQNLLP